MSNDLKLPRPSIEQIEQFDKLETQFSDAIFGRINMSMREQNDIKKKIESLKEKYDWSPFVFEENGLKGIKNVKDQIEVPAKFDEIIIPNGITYPNLCSYKVYVDNKIGVVIPNGEGTFSVIPRDDISSLEQINGTSLYQVFDKSDDNHFGIMYRNEFITPFIFDKFYNYDYGCVILEADGKLGLIAVDQGYIYVHPLYDKIEEDNLGFTFYRFGKKGLVTCQNRFYTAEEVKDDLWLQGEIEDDGIIGYIEGQDF